MKNELNIFSEKPDWIKDCLSALDKKYYVEIHSIKDTQKRIQEKLRILRRMDEIRDSIKKKGRF